MGRKIWQPIDSKKFDFGFDITVCPTVRPSGTLKYVTQVFPPAFVLREVA